MRTELTIGAVRWVRLLEPSGAELAAAARELSLETSEAAFLTDSLTRTALIERKSYTLLRVEVPVFDKKLRASFGVVVDCILTPDSLVMLQAEPIPAMEKLIDDVQHRPDALATGELQSPRDALEFILQQINQGTLRKLDRLSKYVDIAEDAVFQGNERKMVEEISLLMRDIGDLRKIVRPQRSLFTAERWPKLAGDITKMWDGLEALQESIMQLARTNNTLLQHKENELLRLLTLYSIVAIPVWILITPFNPSNGEATILDIVLYWGLLVVLAVALIVILARFRGKRIL